MVVEGVVFPQPHGCGLIEATACGYRRCPWPHFRSRTAAASLKHDLEKFLRGEITGFPQPHGCGLIEAGNWIYRR